MSETEPELPLLASPRNSDVVLVTEPEQFQQAVSALSKAHGWFAVDAERASGFKYSNRAYLLQVVRGDSPIYLFDTYALSPELDTNVYAPLAEVLKTDGWILHAATQDLPCLQEMKLVPTKLFDTELAGRLLNLPRVGLGAMVEHFLKVKLAKEHSAVDWSTRPLHADWLNYAALDVDVLEELRLKVQQELDAQSKNQLAVAEFKHLLSFKPKPTNPDKWRTLSGLHEIKVARNLAVAQQLWIAREELAIKLDIAPGRLIPDASIVSAAKNLPASKSELASLKSFAGRASRSYLDHWWKALSIGLQTKDVPALKLPSVGIPHHRNWAQRFPEADKRLNALKPIMAALAEEQKMPPEQLLTPEFLRKLCWQPPLDVTENSVAEMLREFGARDWQVNACSFAFAEALKPSTEAKAS